MLLTDILEKNARRYAEKTALVMRLGYRTVAMTYREVHELSVTIACFLKQQGVEPGDKVLLLAPNSPYWICVFWGTLLRGAVIVPLNIQSTGEMVRKIAEQTEAKIIFTHLHYKEDLPARLIRYDIELIREETRGLSCAGFQKAAARESDVAEILYTSGTTGEPKGVVLTHRNIYSNVEAVKSVIPISSQDRFLSILPLSHIFEQVAGFLIPFTSGAKIVYAHSPAAIANLLKEHRITKMGAVPEFLRIVMSKIEARAAEEGRKKLFDTLRALSLRIGVKPMQHLLFRPVHKKFGGCLRTVACGGAPLGRELEKKWEALGIDLLQGYGLTETSPVVTTNTYRQHRGGSVGKAVPGVQVKIAKDGEILVKGPNVFQGYYNNEQKTHDAFTTDGWFQTDDIGEMDQDGFLFIKGRKKYMIKGPGAQNVYPEDIEFVLNTMPGVKDNCVVGLQKENGQVEIHAVLLPDPALAGDFQAEEIIAAVNKKLASYQRISGWSIWPEDDFPRSATRKVKKEDVLKFLRAKKEALVRREAGAPKTPLMHLLAEITGASLKDIDTTTAIVPALSLDSLLRVELVARIEEKFGVTIEEAAIDAATTVSHVEAMIKTATPKAEERRLKGWLLSWPAVLLRTLIETLCLFPLIRIFMTLRVEGRERLHDLRLPVLLFPNHLSYLDHLAVLMALPSRLRRRVAFAAARDVLYEYYTSLVWLIEPLFNTFPFPRREHEDIKGGLQYLGRVLDAGFSVIVYPEGRMSETGTLLPLKRGAGLMAVEMGVAVVPIKIIGTNRVLPYAKIRPRRRGLVTVTFGEPLQFSRRDSYIAATEKIQEVLRRV